MKRRLLIALSLFLCGLLVWGFRPAIHSSLPAINGSVMAVGLHPQEPGRLLAASDKKVYIREGNQNWRQVFSLPPNVRSLRHLVFHPFVSEKIYLVSPEGLMEGNLKTKKFQRLFWDQGGIRNRVTALAIHPQDPKKMYLGTSRGLFFTRDGGKKWASPFEWPENQSIEWVGFLPADPPVLLMGTKNELFFSKDEGQTFESGFSLSPLILEDQEDEEGSAISDEDPVPSERFTSVAYSQEEPLHLWVGTHEGIFESRDGGIVWQKLSDQGLQDRSIADLIFSKQSGLIVATPQGVFRFLPEKRRWQPLPIGLTEPPHALALSANKETESLWVAAGTQVLEWIVEPSENLTSPSVFLPSPDRVELFKKLQRFEPSIQEVQKAAIRYASVSNGKIQRWHWGSRMRAFIPHVSFSKSLSVKNNIDIDRGGTNNPDTFISGPDNVDKGWNAGLTWELGDLLYSSAQTSIDSRAKLLVELRESILNEVTRIYFERRRAQMEVVLSPNKTVEERWDLMLRLQELTAQLDALTNGYFSKQLEKLDQEEPELKNLREGALQDLTI